jgi:hypothetical protein
MRLRLPVGARDCASSQNVQTDSVVRPVPIKWVKRPGREGDHSLPSSVKAKNIWSYNSTFTLPYSFVGGS